jgi:hypothetical protein
VGTRSVEHLRHALARAYCNKLEHRQTGLVPQGQSSQSCPATLLHSFMPTESGDSSSSLKSMRRSHLKPPLIRATLSPQITIEVSDYIFTFLFSFRGATLVRYSQDRHFAPNHRCSAKVAALCRQIRDRALSILYGSTPLCGP